MNSRTICAARRSVFAVVALLLASAPVLAQGVKLAKHPHYHNGKIVFSYLGDLWQSDADGDNAQRLTVHDGRDMYPRYSPDGKWIAFSSSRYGNSDVYVMPASGGPAKRLTYHSAGDTVVGWSPNSQRVMFSSARGEPYPMGIPRLYEVPVAGGLEKALPTDWGYCGSYSPDGTKLAFNRHPARWYRRHYRGSYAADLWVMDLKQRSYKRIVDDKTPDPMKANNLWPMYTEGAIYFVSDRATKAKAGSPEVMKSVRNIWKVAVDSGELTQVTNHNSGRLFFPSLSTDGKIIAYEHDFGVKLLNLETGKSKEVQIEIKTDLADNNLETKTYNSEADAYDISPSGKRAAISIHGELFSIPTGKGATRRLTGTPHVRENSPQWSPDGKYIAFLGNKDGLEDIYIVDEYGKNLKKISQGQTEKGAYQWSPDGKSILFGTSDFKLYRYDLEGGNTKILAKSNISSISDPQWSPDGKWISYIKQGPNFLSHIYIKSSDGGQEKRVTDDTSLQERLARWTADGKYLVYLAGGDVGGSRGSGRMPSTGQIYALPLQKETSDPDDEYIDSEAEAQKARKKKTKELVGKMKKKQKKEEVHVKIDFKNLARRAKRLTQLPDAITSVLVTPDSQKVVFVTVGVEGGRPAQSVWSVSIDGGKPSRVAQGGPSPGEATSGRRGRGGFGGSGFSALQFSKDGRTLYYKRGKSIYAMPFSGGAGRGGAASSAIAKALAGRRGGASTPSAGGSTGKKLSFTARVQIDHAKQRQQVFQEAWFVMRHRFYDEGMHGVEWNRIRQEYEPLLQHVAGTSELHDVVNMMLGELNASHTGISGGSQRGDSSSESTRTNSPGFELEEKDGRYRVSHIYKDGPADKDYIKLNVGDYILAVDDQPLKAGDNYWKAYDGLVDSRWTFTVNSKPNDEGAWKVRIKPISSGALTGLQYQKWVDDRRKTVDKLSGGKIGYLHIRQMNSSALRQFEKDIARLQSKKALIIDQRFNPGGNIDQELLQILQQKVYQLNTFRGSKVKRPRPMRGYFGPMVVLANERSTSDAEVFPDGFRTLGLGKVIGVTTYGAVIGTGSYSLMDGSSIRTPGMGLYNVKDGSNLENLGVPPDIYVDNRPEDFFAGRDRQLERAVQELQKELRQ